MGDDGRTLIALTLIFVPLSLVSIGGGPSVFAEMQHQAVTVQRFMSEREFADLFAISRAAPGPGVLLTTLIGWKAAGWVGALVASLAFFVPSSLLVYGFAHVWNRWRGSAWHAAVEAGLAPIAVGLILAGGYAILRSGNTSVLAWTIAAAVAGGRLRWPRVHPLALLGLGAAVFALAQPTS
jgi:chromate transporter